MYLSSDDFKHIIRNTPLISIDLILEEQSKKYLLGLRTNRPAAGFWFVPGGRIYKNESISEAFNRITLNELGLQYDINEAHFRGIYEHFYNDNYFDETFTTQYIVLGYEISLNDKKLSLNDLQHSSYKWFTKENLLICDKVHQNTKAYFS